MDLQPFDWWLESHQGHGCLSLVTVTYSQAEVLHRADHLSRRVLPSLVSPTGVIMKHNKLEESLV